MNCNTLGLDVGTGEEVAMRITSLGAQKRPNNVVG